ncbi:MAG TPA: LLM class F420-dependent oxidoreductase [Acidimicrobiales bacterium]|nr:LLM class F420-dependent oxidoreductase [Acidimicrobiales bacterium]
MIRVGLQLPNFTFPGVGPGSLFGTIARTATSGEQHGFDSIWVMDHFYQLPALGPPDHEMLESYTLLGGLAAVTATARLGTLVTGVTYRNPAILAKQVTTLDVLSNGRALLGIGAAWYDFEHRSLGVPFPPVGERMDRLEEALQICRAMFGDQRPTFEGRYYRVEGAINQPPPVQPGGPPILVGGSGERRTLRAAGRYADAVNLICARADIPRKRAALARHAEEAGRDPATINTTWLASAIVGDAPDAGLGDRVLSGTAAAIAERAAEATVGQGLDGVILNFPLQSDQPDTVASVGEAVREAVGGGR